MNMFAMFDENPAMTLQDIKETKWYGWTDGRTDGRTLTRTDNVKTVYPPQTKFAGGIINLGWSIVYMEESTIKLLNKIIFALANSVDPDEMPHYVAFHLCLHYLPKYTIRSH